MKVTIAPKSKALAFVTPLARGRSTLPVLNCVRIAAAVPGAVEFQSTDLDTVLTYREETDTPAEGVTLIAERSLKVIAASGGTIDSNCTTAKLQTATGEASVTTVLADEWPVTVRWEPTFTCTLPAVDLHEALRAVQPAQSTDASRYVLNGIRLEFGVGQLLVVATDGRCLHKAVVWIPAQTKGEALIPSDAVKHILRLPAKSGTVEFSAGRTDNGVDYFRVTAGEYSIEGKQIQGNFPNWRMVVPKESEVSYQFPCKGFLEALAAVKHIHNDKDAIPVVTLSFGDVLGVSAKNKLGETAAASVPAGLCLGKKWSIGFDAEYLTQILKACPEPDAVWRFTDERGPAKVTCGGFTAVLMPVRLS